MNRKQNILAAFLIVMIALGTLIGCSSDSGKNADKLKKDYSNIEMNPNISVPGYESLELKAGTKKQNVNFYNPGVNTCYFRISLVLKADGTGTDEAESVLWTSDLIEPGEKIKNIKIDRELESGEYPAYLKYECFSLKDETPLNGSNVELTLMVQ